MCNSSKRLNSVWLTLLLGLLALPAAAQQAARVQAQEETEPTRAVTSVTQAASREDALRAAIKQCGRSCKMGGSGRITAGGGGTLDYNCDDDGNCACFGAKDCVKMSDVCQEGSMGCNEQGCICKEDTGGGG